MTDFTARMARRGRAGQAIAFAGMAQAHLSPRVPEVIEGSALIISGIDLDGGGEKRSQAARKG